MKTIIQKRKLNGWRMGLALGLAITSGYSAWASKCQATNLATCQQIEGGGCNTCKKKGLVGNGEAENKCIKVSLGMGSTTPWSGSRDVALRVFADDESQDVFTRQSLYAVCGYTFKRVGSDCLSDGVTPATVIFSHPAGESVRFTFRVGESVARPDEGHYLKQEVELRMVDSEGYATLSNPVYYDLYPGDGTMRRFLASNKDGDRGRFLYEEDAAGVRTTAAEMGLDFVRDYEGLVQLLTPSALADVTDTDDGYEVRIWTLQTIPARDASTGRYIPPSTAPVSTMRLVRGEEGRFAYVYLRTGSDVEKTYRYEFVDNDWSLLRPSGVEERRERAIRDSEGARLVHEVYGVDGTRLSREEKNYGYQSWGYALTNVTTGFGDAQQTANYSYILSGNGYAHVATKTASDGLETTYTYDAENRVLSETRQVPDGLVSEILYDYTPLDPRDEVGPIDARPRRTIQRLDGKEISRTYAVYTTYTDLVERAAAPLAPFGASDARRTRVIRGQTGIEKGRVVRVEHEDGSVEAYAYAREGDLWRETVTHLTLTEPNPVSGRTTREVSVVNYRGENVLRKTEAFIGENWYNISQMMRAYDNQGRLISERDLAGNVTTSDWNCCHRTWERRSNGVETRWHYDAENRLVAVDRIKPTTSEEITTVTTTYRYDDLGREIASGLTNKLTGVGLPESTRTYDALGRVTHLCDEAGRVTTTRYLDNGLLTRVTYPNGATRETYHSADAHVSSVTGTAVTPERVTREVPEAGLQRTETRIGGDDSARVSTRVENMLGEVVRETQAGVGGETLTTTRTYDAVGRLVRVERTGSPVVEYEYDTLGERFATVTRVGETYRRQETTAHFELRAGEVWLVQQTTQMTSDASATPLIETTETQLTGLTAARPAFARRIDVRGQITEAWTDVTESGTYQRTRVAGTTNVSEVWSVRGQKIATVDAAAATNTVVYDALGRVASTTDGRGATTQIEYDALGRRAATVDAAGARTTYGYNDDGELASVTDPLGNTMRYEYDLRGQKTYEGGATYPVRYTYDVYGQRTAMTTYRDEAGAAGDTTTWAYDEASGVVTNKTYADGNGTAYTYDAQGRLLTRAWSRGLTTTYAYDDWGNLISTAYSDGTPTITLTYDAWGRQIAANDVAGYTTFLYDDCGALTNETVVGIAGTNAVSRFYDVYGRNAGYALNGEYRATLGYEAASGRAIQLTTPVAWGEPDDPTTDATGRYTWQGGDAARWGFVNSWSGVSNGSFPHLASDRVIIATGTRPEIDFARHTYTIGAFTNYTHATRLKNGTLRLAGPIETRGDARSIHFENMTLKYLGNSSYYADRAIRVYADNAGVVFHGNNTVEGFCLRTSHYGTTFGFYDGHITFDTAWNFGDETRLLQIVASNATVSAVGRNGNWSFAARLTLGNLTPTNTPILAFSEPLTLEPGSSFTVDATQKGAGVYWLLTAPTLTDAANILSHVTVTAPEGATASVSLTGTALTLTLSGIAPDVCEANAGASTAVSTSASFDSTPATFTWNYEPGSNLKSSLVYPNGTAATWAYDARGALTQVDNRDAAYATLSRYDYTYDAAGRRVAKNDEIYAYNARSELTNATSLVNANYRYAYDFDDIGNRETSLEREAAAVDYTVNNLNQYTSIASQPSQSTFTPTYDADGNQTLVKTKTGIWQVEYNGENRPVKWTCGATSLVMAFDRMGRRVLCEVRVNDTPIKTETFVYDGYTCILRQTTIHTNATPTVVRDTFIWDPTESVATRPLVWQREGSETAFYFHDGNKNVSDVVSASGEVLAHYTYAPFGDCTATGSLAESNPWRFSSEYADDELGCVYYNYRHYEPMMGRWLSRDPIGLKTHYLMNGNNLKMFDYLGLLYEPTDWDWDDFVKWYFKGDGEDIDLSSWSLLDEFKEQISASISRYKSNVMTEVKKSLKPCNGEGSFETDISGTYKDRYGFQVKDPAMHWYDAIGDAFKVLNQGNLTVNYNCKLYQKCQCCEGGSGGVSKSDRYSLQGYIVCDYDFVLEDEFSNPLDKHGPYARRYGKEFENKYNECVKKCAEKWLLFSILFGPYTFQECVKKCDDEYGSTELPFSTPYKITAKWHDYGRESFSYPCK